MLTPDVVVPPGLINLAGLYVVVLLIAGLACALAREPHRDEKDQDQ